MGGPSSRLLFRDRLSEDQTSDLRSWLTKCGEVRHDKENDRLWITGDPSYLERDVEPEVTPTVVVSLRKPEDEFYVSLPPQMSQVLGWAPRHFIEVEAKVRHKVNDFFLGRLLVDMADR